MQLQSLQGKCTDIVCANEQEFDKVVRILGQNGWVYWDNPFTRDSKEMVRLFSDGEYARHHSYFAGSREDSTVITASTFITSNT